MNPWKNKEKVDSRSVHVDNQYKDTQKYNELTSYRCLLKICLEIFKEMLAIHVLLKKTVCPCQNILFYFIRNVDLTATV